MAENNNIAQAPQVIDAEEVNHNDAPEESIAAIYDWMVAEAATTKKRKREEKQEKKAKKRAERKRMKELMKDVKEYRKSKKRKTSSNVIVDEAGEEDEEERAYYSYEITDSEECSVIKVKIIHLWKTPTKNMNGSSKGENINMLLIDEKGHKIHACANHYVLDLIRPMLKKNNCIIISNFNLYTKLEGVRLTNHLGKIYFTKNTSISVVKDFVCVHDGFEFIKYRDIINNNTDNNVAFDIIGLISSKPKLKAIDIRKKTTIISEFKLQNLSGDEVNVTLWEDNAHKLDSYVSHKDIQNEPIVLIIQLAKINTWGNEQEVSTLPFCTKVIINENIPAITAFKQRRI
ncbi:replication protein A 70 kDa DNA-binding subunit D [Artemisia annua]|uniref:Replication protein A 70 kDa DNA-binding subunit D n=1 Tax=Artemisia annua TaxID=35608 RepID=A0A2U1P2M3_ARTAN|nr:replication protein A 70 kDa DNA-binding subunit D [Artemisia annua]